MDTFQLFCRYVSRFTLAILAAGVIMACCHSCERSVQRLSMAAIQCSANLQNESMTINLGRKP